MKVKERGGLRPLEVTARVQGPAAIETAYQEIFLTTPKGEVFGLNLAESETAGIALTSCAGGLPGKRLAPGSRIILEIV